MATKLIRNINDEWPKDVPVGTFDISLGGVQDYPAANAHILFVCPNNKRCAVLLGSAFVDRPNPEGLCVWKWNGDLEKPTIEPSINCIKNDKGGTKSGGCGWHGHISNGEFK